MKLTHSIISRTFRLGSLNSNPVRLALNIMWETILYFLGQVGSETDEHPYMKRSNNGFEVEKNWADRAILENERNGTIHIIYSSPTNEKINKIHQSVSGGQLYPEGEFIQRAFIRYEYNVIDFVSAAQDYAKIIKLMD